MVTVTAAFLSTAETLFVIFLTDFTLDWKSDGMRFQISPEFIFARSSDFSQPPTVVFAAFILDATIASILRGAARKVSPALPEPSARSSWLIPTIR